MVTTRIRGGLGNQLFIYACGYSVAKKNNDSLILDVSDYEHDNMRQYVLDYFDLDKYEKTTKKFINNKLGIGIMRLQLMREYKCIWDKNFNIYQKKVFNIDNNAYLYGYWQSDKYFCNYSNDIRRQFQLRAVSDEAKSFQELFSQQNSIAVHIRRGDYIKEKWILKINYYNEGIRFMEKKVINPVFYFFSDDIQWTKAQFGNNENFRYVEYGKKISDIDEFWIMSNCKHFIIANSTFSWWAAWLGKYIGKIVIAPKVRKWSGDFYPEEWTLLEAELED